MTTTERASAGHAWPLLLVLSGNMVLDATEVSLVLVALPVIGNDLGLSPLTVQWLMSGFALGFAALLTSGPRLAARFGRRRVYLAAMLGFALASVAGGLADGPALLIATRVVKGACAALTAPMGLAIIGTAYPEGPERRRAVSVYSAFGAAGFTAGLLVSGALLEAAGWRWVFLLPAPVALVLLLWGLRLVPHEVTARPPSAAGRAGLPAPEPPGRDRVLLRTGLGAATLNGTYHGLLFLLTFQMQGQLGLSPWTGALALLPACVPLAVSVPFAGSLVRRHGTGRLIALGAAAPLLGYLLAVWRPPSDAYLTRTLPVLLLVGAGFVLSFAALNMRAAGSVPPSRRATAIPLYQMAVQLGAVLLLPLTAWLLTAFDDPRPALAVLAVVAAAGLAAALPGLRDGRPGPPARKEPA
ncbi:MFS transporter [Streptomyces drozdowiczii]|uniref:MFS transporter n=1 Tax=Streptomyces drozdowiczii TaxID=202862 RepID=A0ABY6Q027_9ACTN|nr:MFS transporter [Streptomyces drozdowiczii]MCX0242130.1 MFS transporter [Streptomyces drozdowiczii]UZK57783.1 MFS transporter [Streptomyces drozdowiczii]